MLRHTFDPEHGVLELSPAGPLTAEDFTAVAAEIDPFIETNGRLQGLMITAAEFPGWSDFATLVAHLRFVRDHHKHIRRVAVVSDDNVLKLLPHLASHFVAAEVKHFPASESSAAQQWLRAGEDA